MTSRTAESPWSLRGLLALDADRVVIGAQRADTGDFDAPMAIFVFERGTWAQHPAHKGLVGLATLPDTDGRDRVLALWKSGVVEAFSPSDPPGAAREVESIDRVVPGHPRKKTYGDLTCLRRVGDSLFACGASGQIYRRDSHGRWAHFDDGVLGARAVEGNDLRGVLAFGGTSETDLYVVIGEFGASGLVSRLHHHDGQRWSRVDLPSDEVLNGLFAESPDQIHLCGRRSWVITGHHRRGFAPLVSSTGPHAFVGITTFEEALFLASNHGVVRLDRERGRPLKVRTGLDREPGRIHTVTVAGGALFCAGDRDLVRFDGTSWSRVELPDVTP